MQLEGFYSIFDFNENGKDFSLNCALYVEQNTKYIYDFFNIKPKEKPVVFIDSTKKQNGANYKTALVYEFANYARKLFNKKYGCGKNAAWLSCGVASYLSEQYKEQSKDGIFNASAKEIVEWEKDYSATCGFVVEYLIESRGKEVVLELLKNKQKADQLFCHEIYENAKNHFAAFFKQLQ